MDLPTLIAEKRWDEVSSQLDTPSGKKQVSVADNQGYLPLDRAVEVRAPPQIVIDILRAFPHAARRNLWGVHLLHIYLQTSVSMKDQVNVEVVDALIQAHPPALKVHCNFGWLPLHKACSIYGEDAAKVTECLLRAHPEGAAVRNRNDELPLHLACRVRKGDNGSSVVTKVRALLEVYPEAARATNAGGKLPLHLVLESAESQGGMTEVPQLPAVCKLLLGAYPEAAHVPDGKGVSWSQKFFQSPPFISSLTEITRS